MLNDIRNYLQKTIFEKKRNSGTYGYNGSSGSTDANLKN